MTALNDAERATAHDGHEADHRHGTDSDRPVPARRDAAALERTGSY
jgi:hypothetical protein